jgi:general secretion pathway protein D/MSHA biogenesis protein MshL
MYYLISNFDKGDRIDFSIYGGIKMCSNINKLNNILYRIWHDIRGMLFLFLIIVSMTGCVASKQSPSNTSRSVSQVGQVTENADVNSQAEVQVEKSSAHHVTPPASRPSVNWQPSFTVEDIDVRKSISGLPELKVGASISSRENTVSLREAIKALAQLKGFTVSWNSDVVQDILIDVDIKPDDDFWKALENMLRQLDYWYEFKDNTLIIGYGKTVNYIIAMPNVANEFTASIGGNMLGGSTSIDNLGELSMTTVKSGTETDWAEEKTTRYINRFDVWKSIRQNLDVILRISEGYSSKTDAKGESGASIVGTGQSKGEGSTGAGGIVSGSGTSSKGGSYEGNYEAERKAALEASHSQLKSATWRRYGDGEYTVDESLGIITVTTTETLHKSVKKYIETLKKWLFCQVSIKAHILEVELSEESSKGIDWSKVLKAAERGNALISGNIEYGDQGTVYDVNYTDLGTTTREGLRLLGKISLAPTDFRLLVNAMEEQGNVHTVSEPRLNLLNGSPGVLTIGESVRYISKITAMRNGESGEVDYSVDTDDILSGLAFFVLCNVLEEDEVVLYLTPVTSQLQWPIEYKQFGDANLEVGLPIVKLRQMSTMAKVRDGDLLIIGGLIDQISDSDSSEIPLLGKIPFVKWAFKNETKTKLRRELIIILQPHILPM